MAEALTRSRLILLIILLGTAHVLWGLVLSMTPPFYPQEAERKGATPAEYANVYGMVFLAAFFFSPIFAKYGHKIGAKTLFFFGAMFQGFSAIAFGLLEFVYNTTLFILLSYVFRFIYGVADSACMSAIMAIFIKMFPSRVGFVISCSETVLGLGLATGPAVGGVLYAVGGFSTPFLVVGVLIIVCTVPSIFILPKLSSLSSMDNSQHSSQQATHDHMTVGDVLRSPISYLPYIDAVVFCTCLGFVESLLTPYLESTGATDADVSINFAILGVIYTVAAPIVGYFCDHMHNPVYFSLSGAICTFVSLFIMGPAPFLPFTPSKYLIFVASGFLGLAQTQAGIASLVRAKRESNRLGFSEDIPTYLTVSGLWYGSFYLGNFIGPFVGGFLVESSGFAWTAFIFSLLNLVPIVLDLLEIFIIHPSKVNNYNPL